VSPSSDRLVVTHAVILRRKPWRENSFLLEVFSPDLGRTTVIAQGARREQSAGETEPLTEYELTLYKSSGPYFLRGSHLVRGFRRNYQSDTVMYAACELYEQLILSPEDAPAFWELLVQFFDYVRSVERHPIAIFWRFALRVCHLLGVDLDIEHCTACGATDAPWAAYLPLRSGLLCRECLPRVAEANVLPLSKTTSRLLHDLPHIGNVLREVDIADESIQQVNRMLLVHLASHFHKPFHVKSLQLYG